MNQNINVTVYTSLPPNIDKQDPYFYLNLNINYIKWISTVSRNYEDIFAKVLWWGEESKGSIFIPRCVNLAGYKQSVRTHAIYPVRVPLNHFTTYLTDMNKLYIDIIDKKNNCVVGRACIDNMEQLAYNKGLQSLCSIVNEKNNKIGEIMVAMSIEICPNQKNNDITNGKSNIITNVTRDKGDNCQSSKSLNQAKELCNMKIGANSYAKDEKPDNLIDDLIDKSKKIREAISIDAKNDEINNAIFKKMFPDAKDEINDLKTEDRVWLNDMLVDGSVNDFSLNDISKINTESILKLSEFSNNKSKKWKNNDRECIKLIADSDSYCSESGDFEGKYQYLSKSEANLLRKLDKDISSDDDPRKHESIIEELFYKQTVPDNALKSDTENTNQSSTTVKQTENINKDDQNIKDFEMYQILSQNNSCQNKMSENMNNMESNDYDPSYNDEPRMFLNSSNDRNWYTSISSIKIFLDMLWLNSSSQASKNARSRSQSPNCSSDRERMRKSYDSASSFNSSASCGLTKPPLAQAFQLNPSCKYFVDYKIPTDVSQEGFREKENLQRSYTTRVAVKLTSSNSNTSDTNVVKSFSLDHVSEFPVSFNDRNIIQKWWKGIVRFKLISQDASKKEVVVGVAIVPLRNLISTNNFYRLVPVRLSRNKLTKSIPRVIIGSLALRTAMILSPTKIVFPSDGRFEKSIESRNQAVHLMNKSSNSKYSNQPKSLKNYDTNKRNAQHMLSSLMHTSPLPAASMKISPLSLESFLHVSNIRYVNPKSTYEECKLSTKSCNLYFIGRLLWAPDFKIKSRILWGTSKVSENQSINEIENFKLSEKLPLVLTGDLLEKLKNNYSILEVWDISHDKTKTSLYGLVKIPVNIFYMSFNNEKIRKTVLSNVYPLLSCDDWINIEDPITGKSKGQIHVLLAIGSPQQIENLQLSKENTDNGHWNRNYLTNSNFHNEMVEHSIELDIESLRNFYMYKYSEGSYREVYFYIQYHFPLQNSLSEASGKNLENATFRSVNNLVQSNVDICDTNRHRFRLPIDCSLKSMLNKHFEALRKKHILFELFVKQYDPFPSSKSVAKGRLQVASLFQLINQHSVDIDSHADTVTQQQIPICLSLDDTEDPNNAVGVLNVRLCYRTRMIQNLSKQQAFNTYSPYDQPIVRIEILSATGLQYAAENVVESHPELQYPSVTGINCHVKFWVTDESNKQSRIYVNSKGIQKFQFYTTKTIPRTFTPKFDHIAEMLFGPIIDDENSNSLYKTLAEKILCGLYQLNVEVYHDVFDSLYCDFDQNSSTSKILIGKGRISLADLLLRSSGFMGPLWLPIFSPLSGESGLGGSTLNWTPKKKFDSLYTIEKRKSVGAVEIRLGFNDKLDRKTVLQLAMDHGYVVPWTNRLETEDLVWQNMDVYGFTFKYITINIEEVELSEKLINSIYTPEAGFKKSSMKILTRYRMYKQAVSNSPNYILNKDEIGGKVFIPINHEQKYCYRVSSDLFRYLRESKLEIQVWAIYGSLNQLNMNFDYDQSEDPNDVRLLGSGFFELSNLILPCDQQEKSLSHIVPIWKRGVANCGNSNVTVTVHICGSMSPMPGYNSENDDQEHNPNSILNEYSAFTRTGNLQRSRLYNQQSFPVHVIVEKAVNLKFILPGNKDLDANDNSYKPWNYFVSFPCADEDKSITSSLVKGYKNIIWNFECDTRLQYNLLTDEKQTLDFKIFYSSTDSEHIGTIVDEKILIGIVKLDISLLLKGFERVIGWYNIIDMQGDCQGQLKVGVTPLVPLVPNTAVVAQQNANHTILNQPPKNKPMTIEDHQDYLSSVRLRLRGQTQNLNDYPISAQTDNQSNLGADGQEIISRSILYDTLKEKLRELDVINDTFKKKMEYNEINNNSEIKQNGNVHPNVDVKVLSKVDYGTNTEENQYQFQNDNFNNNNSNIYIDDFETEEKDKYESNDDESSIGEYNNCGKCINEWESPSRSPKNIDDLEIVHDFSLLDDQDNISVSNPESKSESVCYSNKSIEIGNQSADSSRSISSCSHYNGSERAIDDKNYNTQHVEINNDEMEERLSDSWDETIIQASTLNCPDDSRNQVPDAFPKKSTAKIPKFFPKSFDFQEKIKALKRNIETNSDIPNMKSSIPFNNNNNATSKKKGQFVNVTDEEASRISKIFGIRKP